MAHEPIILDRESWPSAHSMVQYNLNRCVNNQHEIRDLLHAKLLSLGEQREHDITRITTQREADLARISAQRESDLRSADECLDSIFSRLSSVETRVAVYGVIAGFVGGGVMSAALMFIFKK